MEIKNIEELAREFLQKGNTLKREYKGKRATLLGFIYETDKGHEVSYVLTKSLRYINMLSKRSNDKLFFSYRFEK